MSVYLPRNKVVQTRPSGLHELNNSELASCLSVYNAMTPDRYALGKHAINEQLLATGNDTTYLQQTDEGLENTYNDGSTATGMALQTAMSSAWGNSATIGFQVSTKNGNFTKINFGFSDNVNSSLVMSGLYLLYFAASGIYFRIPGTRVDFPGSIISDHLPHTYVIHVNTDLTYSFYTLYVDGEKFSTVQKTKRSPSNQNTFNIGSGRVDTTRGLNGILHNAFIATDQIDADAAKALSANPYQVLKPRKTYFVLGGAVSSILLSINNVFHSNTIDNLALNQQNNLAIDSSIKNNLSDNIILTQDNIVSVNSITHNNLSDNLGLLSGGSLSVNSELHVNTSDNLSLAQQNTLAINSALHSNSSSNLTINAGDTLNINNITHSNSVNNIDLVQQNIIAIDSSLKSVISDNLLLSQASTLSINAILHTKADDNVILDFSVIIDIQNSVKSNSSYNLALLQANLLSIAGNLHGNSVDNIDLAQDSTLIISDILHSYLSDNLALFDGAVSLSTNVGTVFMLGNNRNVFVVGSM